MVAELDHRNVIEHPTRVDYQLAVLQRINVALDQQQIRARLYREEPATRNVDAVCTLEVLDGSSCSRLELDDPLAIVQGFFVNDDF